MMTSRWNASKVMAGNVRTFATGSAKKEGAEPRVAILSSFCQVYKCAILATPGARPRGKAPRPPGRGLAPSSLCLTSGAGGGPVQTEARATLLATLRCGRARSALR
jgi:hypothetical protein